MLLEVSLDGEAVVLLDVSLGVEVAAGVAALGVAVDESVLLMLGVLVLPSLVGNAEVDGELLVVGATYGLDAALGELLLGTESVVWAMVTPAALTMAMTAAMLKVLDTSFMLLTPFP